MIPEPPEDEGRRRPRRVPAGRLAVTRGHFVAFTAALVALVGAVPALGWVGYTLIRDSKAGTVITRASDPRAPGYEAIVDPTPTALVIQRNGKGDLVSLVFLALGSPTGGGSAVFIPINTSVERPALGVDRFVTAYKLKGDDGLLGQVGITLNVGVEEAIDVNVDEWAALTAKAAPIRFDNPDTVSQGALRFPAGRIALRPNEVGSYLAALNPGESDLNRLNRQELFWQAWLKAIGPTPAADVIPGETRSGIGLFARTLAAGPVRAEPLAVSPHGVPLFLGDQLYRPLTGQIRRDVSEMVPYPTGPSPGSRTTVRLLNGSDADPIPSNVVQKLVVGGASIAIVGNDVRFGQGQTRITYRDAATRRRAKLMQASLGGRGRLVLDLQGSDAVDVTVVLGRDLLPTGRSASARISPPTTSPGSITTTTRS